MEYISRNEIIHFLEKENFILEEGFQDNDYTNYYFVFTQRFSLDPIVKKYINPNDFEELFEKFKVLDITELIDREPELLDSNGNVLNPVKKTQINKVYAINDNFKIDFFDLWKLQPSKPVNMENENVLQIESD